MSLQPNQPQPPPPNIVELSITIFFAPLLAIISIMFRVPTYSSWQRSGDSSAAKLGRIFVSKPPPTRRVFYSHSVGQKRFAMKRQASALGPFIYFWPTTTREKFVPKLIVMFRQLDGGMWSAINPLYYSLLQWR